MSPKDTAYIVERLAFRFMSMVADYERKLVEHRDSFGVRTSADAKIIDGLRSDLAEEREEHQETTDALNNMLESARNAANTLDHQKGETLLQAAQRVVKERNDLYQKEGVEQKRRLDAEEERDGLLTQVQDQRAEIERLTRQMAEYDVSTVGVVNERNEAWERCDALRAEVAQHRKEHDGDQQAIVGLLSERDKLRAEVAAFRAEVATLTALKRACHDVGEALLKERYALREEVAAYRAEVAALQERLRASIARGDFAEIEVARLKAQAPKRSHPAKVGEWVKKTTDSLMYKIGEKFRLKSYEIKDGQIWCNLDNGASWLMSVCEPCDPPVDHDTPAGKEAAKAVIRDSQMTAIKVGDVVEVFQASGNMTFKADIGAGGIVKSIVPASKELHAHAMIESNGNLRLPAGRSVSLCDVRKVPQ